LFVYEDLFSLVLQVSRLEPPYIRVGIRIANSVAGMLTPKSLSPQNAQRTQRKTMKVFKVEYVGLLPFSVPSVSSVVNAFGRENGPFYCG
jgi:hypothetical protein